MLGGAGAKAVDASHRSLTKLGKDQCERTQRRRQAAGLKRDVSQEEQIVLDFVSFGVSITQLG